MAKRFTALQWHQGIFIGRVILDLSRSRLSSFQIIQLSRSELIYWKDRWMPTCSNNEMQISLQPNRLGSIGAERSGIMGKDYSRHYIGNTKLAFGLVGDDEMAF